MINYRCAFWMLIFTMATISPAHAETTAACFDPGYWVGSNLNLNDAGYVTFMQGASNGADGTYGGTFSVYNDPNQSEVSIRYDGAGYFSFDFGTYPESTLAPGEHFPAVRNAFRSSFEYGIDIGGYGRGCNEIGAASGFEVFEIERNESGIVTKFAADFVQYCEGNSPALFGSIRYNSSLPLGDCTEDSEDDDDDDNIPDDEEICGTLTINDSEIDILGSGLLNNGTIDVGTVLEDGDTQTVTTVGKIKYTATNSDNEFSFKASGKKGKAKGSKSGGKTYVLTSTSERGAYYADEDGIVYKVTLSVSKAKKGKKGRASLTFTEVGEAADDC